MSDNEIGLQIEELYSFVTDQLRVCIVLFFIHSKQQMLAQQNVTAHVNRKKNNTTTHEK